MRNLQKTLLARYQYDALDRLTVHGHADRQESQRFYCESRLATEIQGGERHSIFQHGDQLLAQQTQDSGGRASTLLVTDLQRSVLSALNAGNPHATVYSPYGHIPFSGGLISLLGFNGQRPDPVTGHYLLGNGYRAFNPVLMRFNRSDYLSPFGEGGLNSYAYCLGDPVNRTDPKGDISISNFMSKISTHILAATGRNVKVVKNITRLDHDIYTFQDKYKKGYRLNFVAHGSRRSGLMAAGNGRKLNARELFELAKSKGVMVEKYESYRMVMCHSAPFAQEFSRYVSGPVKAYPEQVGHFDSFINNRIKVGKTYKGYSRFKVYKKPESLKAMNAKNPYESVTFRNANEVRKR